MLHTFIGLINTTLDWFFSYLRVSIYPQLICSPSPAMLTLNSVHYVFLRVHYLESLVFVFISYLFASYFDAQVSLSNFMQMTPITISAAPPFILLTPISIIIKAYFVITQLLFFQSFKTRPRQNQSSNKFSCFRRLQQNSFVHPKLKWPYHYLR